MRRTAVVLVLVLVTGACSVTTPRRETGFVDSRRGVAASATGEDAAALAGGEVLGDDGSAVGGGTSGAGSGKVATAGGGGAAVTGARGAKVGPAAAGPTGAVTGVTKDTVAVSVVAGFSGPLTAMVTRAYDGLATWQDDVNAAGGINGRKVVLKKVDHRETADGGVAACKEALSNGTLFAIVPEGVEATLTAVSCLDAAGMPTFYYSATTDPKWKVAFADIVTSAQGGASMASFVRNRLGGAGKKMGVIYVNQASYKSFADTLVPEAKRIGLDVAGSESVEPNQASFTAPLLRLKNAGVQVLVISATTDAVGILRDAKSMGWNPLFTGWGFQFDFVTGAGRNLFDGVAALRAYATVDSPAYEKYAARMQARGRGRNRTDDLEGFSAYGHALLTGEVIKRAGPNPTRQTVITGAESIKGYDNGILGPITWSASDHVGSLATFPTVCCNSDYTWKRTGPPAATY
ncbi:MAG: branched-chain amino acid transport system substrate-binding protein [Actinomycetota bacterium]|jgi:ABC-type branched-subunit amino acid transport system substrate-binding protein